MVMMMMIDNLLLVRMKVEKMELVMMVVDNLFLVVIGLRVYDLVLVERVED